MKKLIVHAKIKFETMNKFFSFSAEGKIMVTNRAFIFSCRGWATRHLMNAPGKTVQALGKIEGLRERKLFPLGPVIKFLIIE